MSTFVVFYTIVSMSLNIYIIGIVTSLTYTISYFKKRIACILKIFERQIKAYTYLNCPTLNIEIKVTICKE